jgi:RteC protein
MEVFVQQLKERLDSELNEIDPACNPLKGHDQRIGLIKKYIDDLKQFIIANPFADLASEIYYYRHAAPLFESQFVYATNLYNVELSRITMDNDEFHSYLETELNRAKCLLRKYGPFHRYYCAQRDFKDELLFTRKGSRELLAEKPVRMDDNFCWGSYMLSRILAYAQYREFLHQELQKKDPIAVSLPIPSESKITKVQAAELTASIFESKLLYFDKQPASLVQIKERVEVFFNIDLKNMTGLDQKNRARKIEDAPFLDFLKTSYINRRDRLLG